MKGRRQLYVADWNPNGTNDLIVVKFGEIVGVVEQACFGIDVSKGRGRGWVADTTQVYRLADVNTYTPGVHTCVRRVSRKDVLEHLACSPLDPDGRDVLRQLVAAGALPGTVLRR